MTLVTFTFLAPPPDDRYVIPLRQTGCREIKCISAVTSSEMHVGPASQSRSLVSGGFEGQSRAEEKARLPSPTTIIAHTCTNKPVMQTHFALKAE